MVSEGRAESCTRMHSAASRVATPTGSRLWTRCSTASDFVFFDQQFRRQAGPNVFDAVVQVAVFIEPVNDGLSYGRVLVAEMRQVDLPEQVFAQGVAAGIGNLGFARIAVVRAAFHPLLVTEALDFPVLLFSALCFFTAALF